MEYNHPLATTIDEGAEMAKVIAEVADGINCRAERYGHRGGLLQPDRILYPEPSLQDLPEGLDWSRNGRGATVPLVEAVKAKGVKIPVWTACRLDADLGEDYLRRGSLDFVGMTRRLLADPDLPNKVKEGRMEDIRVCHGCLYCFDCRNKNKKLECRVNATLGREIVPEYQFRPVENKKKVLVVGGGPAGMEAARVAARRGHEVVLYEKGRYLGGLEPLAAMVKDLETEDMMGHVKYLETQLKKEKVTVRMNQAVTPEVVRAEKPDVLVVAAGAAHTKFDLPGADSDSFIPTEKLHGQLKTALRFFSPERIERLTKLYMPVGDSVVIMGGKLHGCELAEFLIKRGRQVAIVHDGPESELGEGIYKDDHGEPLALVQAQARAHLDRRDLSRRRQGRSEDPGAGQAHLHGRGKNVMTTQDWGPNTELIDELSSLGVETHVIGSAKDPGWIVDAVREGALVGYAV